MLKSINKKNNKKTVKKKVKKNEKKILIQKRYNWKYVWRLKRKKIQKKPGAQITHNKIKAKIIVIIKNIPKFSCAL